MARYYDAEAAVYDETRGGVERARAAADAIGSLVPAGGRVLDVAGGTGIVSAELAAQGRDVLVADLSPGMLAIAGERLPGRVLVASADRLPVATGSVDLVSVVWLLHLVPTAVADDVIAEATRVLGPGGCLVTTVDKNQSHGRAAAESDDAGRVRAVGEALGLEPAGSATFSGRSRWGSAGDGDPVFGLLALRKR
ncbi:MAG: methyltransferase domain-containing protein [Nocardioides sp.]